MKLYSWNVNGIRAVLKKGDFERFIEAHNPDILCLQETKAHKDQVEIDLPEYEEYWNSAEKKGYSGTAIFTKHSPLDVMYGLPDDIVKQYELSDGYGDTTKEGRVLTLEFEPFYVSTVYTPNAKDDLSRIPIREHWDPAYLAYMKRLENVKPVIYCGDFNVAHTEIDLARPKENEGKKGFTKEERRGFDAMLEAGFVDSFREFEKGSGHYTWWSAWGGARERNVGWRIDYVMISRQLRDVVTSAQIHPDVYGSDHCPVSIDLSLELENDDFESQNIGKLF
jgi:exodeoxyribonuclease-3